MIIAMDQLGVKCVSWETVKDQGPFFCAECKSEVVLKKGRIRIHHFAHKPPINCIYGSGESQEHYQIKKELYEYFITQEHCEKCELERRLKGVRPDISLYINKIPVAIEIQKSDIPITEIERRSKIYTKLGIALLWIIPGEYPNASYHENSGSFVHRIKEWELFIHSMYFGRVYYWVNKNKVRPVHFEKLILEKDSVEWYEPGGSLRSVGGYQYEARRLRLIDPFEKILEIDHDFKVSYRDSFESKNWTVPKSKIYIDKQKKWW